MVDGVQVAWAFGSTTAAAAVNPWKAKPALEEVPAIVPIVADAALLLVVIEITPVVSMVACRLLVASAVLSWFNDET